MTPESTPERIFDLGRPLFVGMPQSPNHPQFRHALVLRHGDNVRGDGGSAANDLIVMGTHVGTHIDALGHVSHGGLLHGGVDAADAQLGGAFEEHGVHRIQPIVGRGVLLDLPAVQGREVCSPDAPLGLDAVREAVDATGTAIGDGDTVFIRTGWGAYWDDVDRYIGRDSGVPGIGLEAARWLADQGVRALGSDTIAFEHIPPGQGHALLPVHGLLLVERGIPIVETMALDELAAQGPPTFTTILSPLKVVGATGAPVRPLAVTP
jgi:kynurenine formamidase